MITIKLCSTCEGTGKVEKFLPDDWGWSTCKKCNGHGKVCEVSGPSVQVPYDRRDIAVELESEILGLVRKY